MTEVGCSMSSTERILLVRLKSIGDIVFTLPAVHAVRESFPKATLVFLTSREHAPILRGFSDIDEVLTLDREVFRRRQWGAMWPSLVTLRRGLRRERFSLTIDFQGYGETALLTWLTRAPQRWGSVYRPSRRWAYTQSATRNDDIHIADWNLSLLHQCGLATRPIRNEFHLSAEARLAALKFFAEHGCDPARPTIFLQPFTSSPQKNWPLENYLALAGHWRAAGVQVIFGGGLTDHAGLEGVRQAGYVTSTGVPLLTTAGLVELSTLAVGGVTGILHLAVAIQKRVVMLIGCAAHEPGFPYQHRDWAVTAEGASPVATIPVSEVITATAQAMAELGAIASPARP